MKWNVDPCPSIDFTQIWPSYRSTIFLQIARPIPLPGWRVATAPRRNIVKRSRDSSSSGSPSPLSVTQPFGKWFSLDGVHPTAAAHKVIANHIIAAINAKYGSTIPVAP